MPGTQKRACVKCGQRFASDDPKRRICSERCRDAKRRSQRTPQWILDMDLRAPEQTGEFAVVFEEASPYGGMTPYCAGQFDRSALAVARAREFAQHGFRAVRIEHWTEPSPANGGRGVETVLAEFGSPTTAARAPQPGAVA